MSITANMRELQQLTRCSKCEHVCTDTVLNVKYRAPGYGRRALCCECSGFMSENAQCSYCYPRGKKD